MLTIQEAQFRFGVRETEIRKAIRAGSLQAHRSEGRPLWLVKEEEVRVWIEKYQPPMIASRENERNMRMMHSDRKYKGL